jgi:lactoylglutathione lyase
MRTRDVAPRVLAVDAACALLKKHGVELLNGPTEREWGLRSATYTEPAGHSWEIAHELPRSESS